MLNCHEVTEHASDYIDRNLPFKTRLAMMMHIAICVHCRRYVHQLRTTIAALAGLKKQDVLDEKIDQTVKILLEERER
jgi:anti-sigma factor RsiW